MASFIGSNLQSLHYNFKHKVAGSTVENPLKIYSGSVNPSNLPAPTSNEWKEIKNQNFIDRLGQQDGNTVVETTSNSVLGNIVSTNAPCDGMMNIEIGGNTLYKRADGTYTDVFEEGCTLKSVGEKEGKIEGLTCGKNLFNPKNISTDMPSSGISNLIVDNNTIKFDYDGTFKYVGVDLTPVINKFKGKNFICSYASFLNSNPDGIFAVQLVAKEAGGNFSYLRIDNKYSYVPNDIESLKLRIYANNSSISLSGTFSMIDLQLEEGTTATPYEPYQEDKINILTTEPLKGLPNGVRDIASGDTVERKIEKDVLDSTNFFIGIDSYASLTTNTIAFVVKPSDRKIGIDNILSNIFNVDNGLLTKDVEGIRGYAGSYPFTIRILKSKLTQHGYVEGTESTYTTAFKAWLAQNPTTVYYELATPTIEKLPQPLTLQSFANGTLQVNTAIPPYIKEWHTTNPDDQGVMQYQSGTTGLSQAFLTQIPLTSITNDIFGGSLPALKSAYKLTSNCDISAYGSGDNNGVETNNISYKVWNGTEYVLLNTSTSNVVSNINNILNNSNYVVDNNIYILMHALPASDTIKSQINLDYFNADIDIARQPDNVVIPDTVKNTYIPTNYTIFAKIACLKTDGYRIISQYTNTKGDCVRIYLRPDSSISFQKRLGQTYIDVLSDPVDFNNFQVIGVVAQQQNTGMKLSVLLNNGEVKHYSNTDISSVENITEWALGQDENKIRQLDGFILDYQFTDKTFTNTECEVMLKGRNTTGDITYDSFVKDYQNGKIQSGFILPNNKYKVIGQAKLYYNDVYIRTVENCEFVAKDDENKVELVGMAEMVRVD